MYKAAAHAEATAGDPNRSFFRPEEKACNQYNDDWAAFVGQCWDDFTRPSECAKDEVTDPIADNSAAHRTHRIHWINTRLDDLVDIMIVLGKERLWDSFIQQTNDVGFETILSQIPRP